MLGKKVGAGMATRNPNRRVKPGIKPSRPKAGMNTKLGASAKARLGRVK